MDSQTTQRQPAAIIPLPTRPQAGRDGQTPIARRLAAALSELEVCLLALGIAADLKLKRGNQS